MTTKELTALTIHKFMEWLIYANNYEVANLLYHTLEVPLSDEEAAELRGIINLYEEKWDEIV